MDHYPFHIYGSQGLAWAKRAPLGTPERIQLFNQIRAVVNEGLKKHPSSPDLITLSQDLTREYLMIAVPEEEENVQRS